MIVPVSHRLTDVGACFGLPEAPFFATIPISKSSLSVTRLVRDVPSGSELAVHLPPQNSYFLMLYLRDVIHCDLLPDSSRKPPRTYHKGSVCLVDLTEGASIVLQSSLDAVAFVAPKQLFSEMTVGFSLATQFSGLKCVRAEPDQVISGIGAALLPAFGHPDPKECPAMDHIAIALCAHLLHNYAEGDDTAERSDRSLSKDDDAMVDLLRFKQTNRSPAEAGAANFGRSVQELMTWCQRVTGSSLDRWSLHERIGLAKDLLADRTVPLSEIVERCGFSSVQEFAEKFSTEVEMTPAEWRASQLH